MQFTLRHMKRFGEGQRFIACAMSYGLVIVETSCVWNVPILSSEIGKPNAKLHWLLHVSWNNKHETRGVILYDGEKLYFDNLAFNFQGGAVFRYPIDLTEGDQKIIDISIANDFSVGSTQTQTFINSINFQTGYAAGGKAGEKYAKNQQ